MITSTAEIAKSRVDVNEGDGFVSFRVDHTVKHVGDPEGLGRRTFEGWASVTGIDFEGEDTPPEAMAKALQVYLQKNPVLLWHHNYELPIGRILSARVVFGKGIYVVGEVFRPDDQHFARYQNSGTVQNVPALRDLAEDVWQRLKAGFIRGLSWQGKALKISKWSEAEDRFYTENAAVINLDEISLTPAQVHPDGQVIGVNTTAKALKNVPLQEDKTGESSMDKEALEKQLAELVQGLKDFDGELPEGFGANVAQVAKACGAEVETPAAAPSVQPPQGKTEEDFSALNLKLEETQKALMALTEDFKQIKQPEAPPAVAPRQGQAAHVAPSGAAPKPSVGQGSMTVVAACRKALANISAGDEEAMKSVPAVDAVKMHSIVSCDKYGAAGFTMSLKRGGHSTPDITLANSTMAYLKSLRG